MQFFIFLSERCNVFLLLKMYKVKFILVKMILPLFISVVVALPRNSATILPKQIVCNQVYYT